MEDLKLGKDLIHNELGKCRFIHYDNTDKTRCTVDIEGMWHHVEVIDLELDPELTRAI